MIRASLRGGADIAVRAAELVRRRLANRRRGHARPRRDWRDARTLWPDLFED